MFKFVALFAFVAVASAAPGLIAESHSIVQPAVLTKTAYVDTKASSAITHQSFTNLERKVPVVYDAAPVIKTVSPVIHTYSAAPVIKTVSPVIHTYAAAPVVKTISPVIHTYAASPVVHSLPVVHSAPFVKTVVSAPVAYATYH